MKRNPKHEKQLKDEEAKRRQESAKEAIIQECSDMRKRALDTHTMKNISYQQYFTLVKDVMEIESNEQFDAETKANKRYEKYFNVFYDVDYKLVDAAAFPFLAAEIKKKLTILCQLYQACV